MRFWQFFCFLEKREKREKVSVFFFFFFSCRSDLSPSHAHFFFPLFFSLSLSLSKLFKTPSFPSFNPQVKSAKMGKADEAGEGTRKRERERVLTCFKGKEKNDQLTHIDKNPKYNPTAPSLFPLPTARSPDGQGRQGTHGPSRVFTLIICSFLFFISFVQRGAPRLLHPHPTAHSPLSLPLSLSLSLSFSFSSFLPLPTDQTTGPRQEGQVWRSRRGGQQARQGAFSFYRRARERERVELEEEEMKNLFLVFFAHRNHFSCSFFFSFLYTHTTGAQAQEDVHQGRRPGR